MTEQTDAAEVDWSYVPHEGPHEFRPWCVYPPDWWAPGCTCGVIRSAGKRTESEEAMRLWWETHALEAGHIAALLTILPPCTQCGHRFYERACGPTHAVIAANPLRHRLFGDLLDPLLDEVRTATLTLVERIQDRPPLPDLTP
jgi:hypothetical protein